MSGLVVHVQYLQLGKHVQLVDFGISIVVKVVKVTY